MKKNITTMKMMDAFSITKKEMAKANINIPNDIETFMKILAMNVGLQMDKPQELKIKRSEDAKQFPLIHIKKDGDVGYDLPAVLPLREEYIDKDIDKIVKKMVDDGYAVDIQEAQRNIRQPIVVNPGDRAIIPTGIAIELPAEYWSAIEARSSTSEKKLIVPKGVIDEGYRGELFAVVVNVGSETVIINHGDRLVQLIVEKRRSANIKVIEVDELSATERGDTGFGSTGQ